MKTSVRSALLALALAWPAGAIAQAPMSATYITKEQIDHINRLPGVDRQIISRDIGALNLSVGIIHRGPTQPAAGRGGGAGAAAAPARPCGVTSGTPSGATGIAHDGQTETYVIVSGEGTLITGGQIMNGNRSAPDSNVTLVLNGPSCSGTIVGEIQSRVVRTGDVIIIPAGVPHGWSNIPDHVDYLSVRPDPQRLLAPYVNPALTLAN